MRLSLFGLFLVLFIDGLGQGILFPILIRDLTNPDSMVLTASHSETLRNAYYGIILGVFFLCWFIGAPILGDLSDSIGRKKTLMICLWGTVVGYLFSALAFTFHSVSLLIIGRVIDGITAGSQPIAQAAAVDISDEHNKTQNIGLVLFSLTLGIVLGPMVGGFLSDKQVLSWFSSTTPLYLAMILAFINIVVLKFSFRDTRPGTEKMRLKVHQVFRIFQELFHRKQVLYLAFSFLIAQIGWGFYYFYISLFAEKRFGFTPIEVSVLFTLLGIGLCIGLAILPKFFPKSSPKKVFCIGYSLLALGVAITMISQSGFLAWIVIIPLAASVALGLAFAMGLFSQQVDASKQGWVMGVTGGVNSIASGLSSITLGFLTSLSIYLPLIFSIILIAIGVVLFSFFNTKPSQTYGSSSTTQ